MIHVAVGIIIRDDRVLLCQRKHSQSYPLQWEFPGGKVENGESIEQCLRRELQEELSIEAGEVIRVEHEVSHYDNGSSYQVHYCFLASFAGSIQNNVFEDVRWVTREQVPTFDILQGNAHFVKRLLSQPFSGT